MLSEIAKEGVIYYGPLTNMADRTVFDGMNIATLSQRAASGQFPLLTAPPYRGGEVVHVALRMGKEGVCPRGCKGGMVHRTGEAWQCLMCGWYDWTFYKPPPSRDPRELIEFAMYNMVYGEGYPLMYHKRMYFSIHGSKESETWIEGRRKGASNKGGLKYIPLCPFCSNEMEQVMSGDRSRQIATVTGVRSWIKGSMQFKCGCDVTIVLLHDDRTDSWSWW